VNDVVRRVKLHITLSAGEMAAQTIGITWKHFVENAMRQNITREAKGGVVRGRTPLPDALKEARGTLKKSRVNQSQARFDVPKTTPKPPATLNLYGKRLWKEMLPKLVETGLYTEGDHQAFELLCMAYGDLIQARKDLKESGTIVITDKGTVYQHPNVGIANQAWNRVKLMLGQFGLTPAERTRVKARSPEEKRGSLAESLFAAAREKVEGETE
jgi:P27 family predicted phage terminase small subunit